MSRLCQTAPVEAILRGFPSSGRYLIGVSGGRDSVALLHLLLQRRYTNLIICHLNHQLRGRAATADARFVESLSRKVALPCQLGATDVRALAKQSKSSIETASRIARYAFFVATARRRRCRTIFLAHHADDLVETAVLNFFRGASPAGIAAMRRVALHRIGKSELTVVRPLLHVWRHEIDDYVKQHRLKFREDESNAQLSATRNRIRHRVLPYIEKQFGRDVRGAIWRATQIWSEEDLLLDSLVPVDLPNSAQLDARALRKLPIPLQRRVVLRWLRRQDVADAGFAIVENVRALADPNAAAAKANLPRNRHARRRAGKLFLQ